MKNRMETRNKELSNYGIDKGFTNFFVFNLQDDIFITSSKDTDYYKTIKTKYFGLHIILYNYRH